MCGESNSSTSKIIGCYNTGTVSSNNSFNVGGVCGSVKGTVTGCYNIGTVSGTNGTTVGGVCGINKNNEGEGEITGCYTNNGGVCISGLYNDITIKDCAEYIETESENKFKDGTVCELLNTALKNANSNVRFYQGMKSPEFIRTPKLVNGVYQISCTSELYWFADKVNNDNTNYGSANAVLTANIVVNAGVLNSDGKLKNGIFAKWIPIGNNSNKYTGTFNGQGHKISGLYFNDADVNYVGLFGYLSGGEIKNVGVIDSYFSGSWYVGGVCGYNLGTITNCYNTGAVSDTYDFIGGVCGTNYGTITNCYNTGTVSGRCEVGGVCGDNRGKVTGCYNSGKVSGRLSIGGVCGYNYDDDSEITGCYNSGTVSGTDDATVGGVCGNNQSGTITGCYNSGTVNNINYCRYIGGVCGSNYGTITDCYNIGTVSGNGNYVGGVCGYNTSTITNCYNSGKVSGKTGIGGVCGNNQSGTITGCYYLDSEETDSIDGTTFKVTEQFASGEVAYLLSQGTNGEIWGQKIGEDSYPILGGKKVLTNVDMLDFANDIIIYGQSASLDGTISFNIYVSADDSYEWDKTVNGVQGEFKNGLYRFTYQVAAKDMDKKLISM